MGVRGCTLETFKGFINLEVFSNISCADATIASEHGMLLGIIQSLKKEVRKRFKKDLFPGWQPHHCK